MQCLLHFYCRLHSDAPDIGLLDNNGEDNDVSNNIFSEMAFPLAMTCHGEDEELQADVDRSPEKPSNETERGNY